MSNQAQNPKRKPEWFWHLGIWILRSGVCLVGLRDPKRSHYNCLWNSARHIATHLPRAGNDSSLNVFARHDSAEAILAGRPSDGYASLIMTGERGEKPSRAFFNSILTFGCYTSSDQRNKTSVKCRQGIRSIDKGWEESL